MTDRYERIRAALAMGPTQGPWGATHGAALAGYGEKVHVAGSIQGSA